MSKLQLVLLVCFFFPNIPKGANSLGWNTTCNTSVTANSTNSPLLTTNGTDDPDHSSDNIRLYDITNFALTGIYTPVMLTVGVLGNFITILLLYRGTLASSSSIYLIGLSISDLIYLSLSMPWVFKVYPSVYGTLAWKAFYSYYVAYVVPIVYMQYTTSVWIIVAFTVERFVVIAYPLKAKLSSSTTRLRLIVASIYILGIGLNFPRFFMYTVATKPHPDTGDSYLVPEITAFGNSPYFVATNFWLSFLFNSALPFLIIGTLNSVIVIKLGAAKRNAQTLTSQGTGKSSENRNVRDSQITRLLFAIVVAFFICNSLGAALSISVALNGHGLNDSTFRFLLLFANCLIETNSMINFILYAICSAAMRNAIKELVCKKFTNRKK